MGAYVIRRILTFIPSAIGVTLIIFIIMRIVPGDPALMILSGADGESSYTQEDYLLLRSQMGLDDSLPTQYLRWMGQLARFDLGVSLENDRPISNIFKERFPVTVQLALLGFLSAVVMGIPIGIISAIKQDSIVDYVFRSIAIFGLAMPTFFVGLIVILVLSVYFNWFPPLGFKNLWEDPWISIQQLGWPALALGFSVNGTMMRMMRAQMLEVIQEDYIRTARSKGLPERVVINRHAVKNAMLPVITVAGTLLGGLLGGTVVIEMIFSIPGMGRALIDAIYVRDIPLIQTFILIIALIYLFLNLLIDLSYGWLNPRIRLT
ncbi:MAG: peptide/nickel transport system permease protein [Chloroflexi bacterium]|jgi:peptide/nickel transport system permease protein|nr:MAG: peptide/nickel transport system permease protein [Chloroflexota bacterium]